MIESRATVLSLLLAPALVAQSARLENASIPGPGGTTLDAERGTLTVPEHHGAAADDASSGSLELAFLRIRSTVAEPGPPIFLLAGGPGSSGIQLARDVAKQGWILGHGDVVGIDQRGVGASVPRLATQLTWTAPLDEPASRDRWAPTLAAKLSEVVAHWRARGVDPDAYDTTESAHDVDAVRRALGYERIVIWGGSYGSHLGLAVLREHGDHVAAAVLTGPEGPDHTLKLPNQVQANLEWLAARIHAEDELRDAVPDLIGMLRDVLDRLERTPERVDLGNGEVVAVGKYDVQILLSGLLGRSKTLGLVPAVVAQMHAGDFRQVARQAKRLRRLSDIDAMAWFVDCASGASAQRLAQIEAEARWCLLGDAINFPLDLMLPAAGELVSGPAFREPVASDVRVLVLAGDLDCRTPITNARDILAGLPNGHLVVVENRGHDLPWGKPAIRDTILGFLRGEVPTTTRITLEPVRLRRAR